MPDDPRDVPGLEAACSAAAVARAEHLSKYPNASPAVVVYTETRATISAYLLARATQAEKSLAPGRYAVWLRQMADEVEVRERPDA